MRDRGLFIGGRELDGSDRREIRNPATGESVRVAAKMAAMVP